MITIATRTAVAYCRVSSAGQAGERHVSLEVQQARFQDYCERDHLAPLAVFIDVASGRKDDRPEYQRMLDYVARNRVDVVAVLFLDRFGRNPREILRRYWQLQEAGTTVESINEDLKEELMLLLRAGIAGQDSRRTSERVKMALDRAAAKGSLVNKIGYGYQKVYNPDGSVHVEQVPEEVAVIREAYELAISNSGYRSIANELNTRGRRTRTGRLWASQTVRAILIAPAIAGRFVRTSGGQTIDRPDAYPAILNAEEWDHLQDRLAIRRSRVKGKSSKSDYLLSGTLRCGHCGASMSGDNKGKRRYYACVRRKMASQQCPDGKNHRKEALETAVLEYLGQFADPVLASEMLAAQEAEYDGRAEKDLSTATNRLGQIEQAFLNDLDRVDRGIMTEGEYLKRQEVRRTEQAQLEERKATLETVVAEQQDRAAQATAVPVKVQNFLEEFSNLDVVQAKAMLQEILFAVHVFNDGRVELEFR